MLNIIKPIFVLLILFGCKNVEEVHNNEYKIEVKPEIMDQVKLDYIMGHFEPSEHEDFSIIPTAYVSRDGLYLRKEALTAFISMHKAANQEGINLTIKSATRNFEYQKGIWERKWNGQTLLEGKVDATTISDPKERAIQILLYSSMPGSSRHHWGTDIDMNNFENSYFDSGQGKAEYEWLLANASEYGYCQPYTSKSGGRTGYEEEKWHWTYSPISRDLTNYAQQYLKNDMIKGFEGSGLAQDIDVLTNYILGIDKSCL